MCERREVKGILIIVRLSELLHHGIVELWEVEIGLESRTEVTVNAISYVPCSLCGTVRTPRMTGRAVLKGRSQ